MCAPFPPPAFYACIVLQAVLHTTEQILAELLKLTAVPIAVTIKLTLLSQVHKALHKPFSLVFIFEC